MGEAFLVAFLQVLADKSAHREAFKYFGLIKGVDQKLNKWNDMLTRIEAVVNEAEERQLTTESEPLKLWLNDLRDLAYDVEDVLDKYATKMLKCRIQQQQQQHAIASTSTIRSLLIRNYSIPNGVFNFKMNTEIQKITDRLQEICQRKELLGLNPIHTGGSRPYTNVHENIRPSSSHPDGPVIGRDEDRTKIVELLSKQECQPAANFDVLALVGMGGLGKTTLAGKVFNDLKATGMFTPAVWVCVSDDFKLEKVSKQILQAITGHSSIEDFNMVQDHLHKALAGKKFLIVLDDVWDTCSHDQWVKLQSPFRDAAPESKILVTTRDEEVSKMVKAQVHKLELLKNDACLEIFEHHAFRNVNDPRPPNFELLKKKIIGKCNGLPLAARTLGGLLLCKETDKWEEILNNPMWIQSKKSGILPVLRLSYHYLPSYLKRCFSYCSILPNDYEFEENQLILLWMAEGMILPRPTDNKQIEDLGAAYFRELVSRSLFQKSSNNSLKYVMHDLVGDLARWAAGETCFRLEDQCFPKARHASYVCSRYDVVGRFEAFSEVRHLRTFLPFPNFSTWNYLSRKVTFDLLPKLRRLRVLSFNGYKIPEVPNTIGKLKSLRYLDLSDTQITSLPESITTLYNLQTLILEGCSDLKALPAGMRNLINLRHFNLKDCYKLEALPAGMSDLINLRHFNLKDCSNLKALPASMSDLINLRHLNNSGVDSLEGMPLQLGRLTNLQSLPKFVVGKGSDHSRIREIGSLSHLRGTLCISRLEDVIDAEDAGRANLKRKDRLDSLMLEWSFSLMLEWSSSSEARDVESANVLEKLQPHGNLRELTIQGYGGKEFSTWIRVPSFSNMVYVRLQSCENCVLLPSLGELPRLKELYISGMGAVESVGPEFYGGGNKAPFPLLETLVFQYMQQWKKWLPFSDHDQKGNGVFPCLKKLSIRRCPKLEGKLPEKLDSLENLDIVECEELVVSSIANYKQLGELNIDGCKEVVHTNAVEFELLKTLALSNLRWFETGEFMKGLTKVADLKITSCEDLMCSLKNDEECEALSTVPKGLHQLASLRELHIYRCPSLVCFPDIGLPPSLQVIEINGCFLFEYLAKYEIPSNLRRIEISACMSLKSLVGEEEGVVGSSSSSGHRICLEELIIERCPSLASLSMRGRQFPRALKSIIIRSCPNLKYLPEGLCHLTNLHKLWIDDCGSLVSIPKLSPSLRQIWIGNCDKLEELSSGDDMHSLNSLQELRIDYSQCKLGDEGRLMSGWFPPNLTSLEIRKMNSNKSCKQVWKHLQRLTSLKKLRIKGEDPDVVSFPPDYDDDHHREKETLLFPKSLTHLTISGFPNLKKLSSSSSRKGFQFLTSLQFLDLSNCPKLASIPEEGLPLSLEGLQISTCPLLAERCQHPSRRDKGRGGCYYSSYTSYWPKISHIPYIFINGDLN